MVFIDSQFPKNFKDPNLGAPPQLECWNNEFFRLDLTLALTRGIAPGRANPATAPLIWKLQVPFYSFPDGHYLIIDVVKGKRAIFLALLMATVSILWCLAQLPEILRGMILPRSVVKYLSDLASL
jgi:hypothetical protein